MDNEISCGAAVLAVALGTVLSSCAGGTLRATPEGDTTGGGDTTSDPSTIALTLLASADLNSYRIGSPVTLSLENHSEEWIWFPTDFGVMIAAEDPASGDWRDVRNLTQYYSVEEILLSPRGQLFSAMVFPVRPDLGQVDAPVRLMISVHGKLYREGAIADVDVEAQVDVLLEP